MIKYEEGETLFISAQNGETEDVLRIFPDRMYLFHKKYSLGFGADLYAALTRMGQKARHFYVNKGVMSELLSIHKEGKDLVKHLGIMSTEFAKGQLLTSKKFGDCLLDSDRPDSVGKFIIQVCSSGGDIVDTVKRVDLSDLSLRKEKEKK
jgi:hypothetical protein